MDNMKILIMYDIVIYMNTHQPKLNTYDLNVHTPTLVP